MIAGRNFTEVIITRLAVLEANQRKLLHILQEHTMLLNTLVQQSGGVDVMSSDLPDGIHLPLNTLTDLQEIENLLRNMDTMKQLV